MIGYLKGKVILIDNQSIIVNVAGVGYLVLASKPVLENLVLQSETQLFIYTHVREDILELFGFKAYEDLKLFKNLLSVSGIGPKTALGIFSIGNRENIINAILKADVEFFVGVPRLGKKNAQKIIIELKSKIGSNHDLDLTKIDVKDDLEVVAALKTFGFTTREATDALSSIDNNIEDVSEKIRLALKYLGK